MYSDMSIAERLKEARLSAGFRSATEAANEHNWTASTYAAHENGTRGVKPQEIQKYASAFRADPCTIAFGVKRDMGKIAGVHDDVLREVVTFVMQHKGTKAAKPEEIAGLIVDLCHYVSQAGEGGLAEIVDFQMHKRAARR